MFECAQACVAALSAVARVRLKRGLIQQNRGNTRLRSLLDGGRRVIELCRTPPCSGAYARRQSRPTRRMRALLHSFSEQNGIFELVQNERALFALRVFVHLVKEASQRATSVRDAGIRMRAQTLTRRIR